MHSNVPMESRRFLGDVSGMAEFVGNNSVLFCRHRYVREIYDIGSYFYSEISIFKQVINILLF